MSSSPRSQQLSGEQASDLASRPASSFLHRAVMLALTLLLAAVGIGIAFLLGRRIAADEWPILVTASALATYLAVTLVDARHGLLLWIVTAPFARFAYLNIELGAGIPNLTLNRIMTGVLVVLILAQLATNRRKLPALRWADLFLVAFLGASALSVPHAIVGLKSAVQSFFDLLVIPIAIYFLGRTLVTNREELRGVMVALLIVGVYLALLATREQLTGDVWFYPEARSVYYTANIRRVVALLGNPAYIAVTIGMAVPWAWYILLKARRHRLVYLTIIGVMMVGIFFCMNRSGWVGLIISLLMMAIFVRRFRPIFLGMLLIAGIVAGAYWAFITSSAAVQERLTAQGPIDYRVETWDVALRMIRDYPVFGIGYENFRYYYRRYGYWDVYLRAMPTPHNTYMWVILMGGVVAFVPFMLFLMAIFVSSFGAWVRGKLDPEDAGFADLAGTFLASMAALWAPALVMDVTTGYYNTMVVFLIMGGFVGALAEERHLHNRSSIWSRVRSVFVRPI